MNVTTYLTKYTDSLISTTGHEVKTAPQMGWAGLRNGALLAKAVEGSFDVFVTVDQNLSFQQPLEKYPITVVVLHGKSNLSEI